MKIKDLEQNCGDCALIDYCAEPFEELCLCTDSRFKELTEDEYIALAEKSSKGENEKIADEVGHAIKKMIEGA
jgi:hypothetical protein